jgi:rod shape-determining protein MreC
VSAAVSFLDTRRRARYLFLGLTVVHVVLISAQVSSRSGVPLLEAVIFGAVAEVQRAATAVVRGVRDTWSAYIGLRGVRAENEALKRALAEARVELQVQRARAGRTQALEALLELRDRTALPTVAAEVIAGGAAPGFRTLTIDKGTEDGVQPDMGVIAPSGIVGRVVVASPRAAKVQLLVDRNAAAGALVERSRAQGVVVGGADEQLRLEYVSEVADIEAGDLLVTSGIDGIYPKGFVIGTVEVIERSGAAYKDIVVTPAVDFSSLEEVLVVLDGPDMEVAPVERGDP